MHTHSNNLLSNLLYTQNHFLSLNVFYCSEDEIPVDATITTFLRGKYDIEEEKNIANLIKKWVEGKGRPHDGSYFILKKREKSALFSRNKTRYEFYPEFV